MIAKREVSEALALSCVESYFLPWLAKRFDVSKLYGESFVPIGRVFDDFSQGAKYEAYEGVPRVQETAERAGIIAHIYSVYPPEVPDSREKLAEYLKDQREDDLCLLRVNEAFFENYKRKAWREDHYICVDGSLCWVNHYPLSEGRFAEERLKEISDGAVCTYIFRNGNGYAASDSAKRMGGQAFSSIRPPRELEKLEGALGVLRVTRKRLEKYFSSSEKIAGLLRTESVLLDKLYFYVRLRRLKGEKKADVFKEALREIIEIEKKIAEAIK